MMEDTDRKDGNLNDQRRKKKNLFNQKEVHSDGYDTDGYKDDEDRNRLQAMPEVERERILIKRMEERNNKKFYDNVAEKAEKVKTTGASTTSNISADQTLSGVDASKKNQVEKDRIQHKKELETRREKYKESHSHANQNDYQSSYHDETKHSSSGQAQHQRERNTESDEFQKLVKQLTLSNDFLNKLILRSNFKELAKGAYVKVKIGTKYEIYKIENINQNESNSSCIFSLFNGIKRRDIDLKFISNQNADQVELCTYYEQNYRHEELSKIQEKKRRFDELLTKKQEKSEKEKYAEIDKSLNQKIDSGFFENSNNLNASELQTYNDFLRDRLLELENQENTHSLNRAELEKLHKEKTKFLNNVEYISKKIKLVKHQFVPIFTKNVLAQGSKISELALNKKNTKIKDKAMIRRQKIQRLQQPYFAFEDKFKMLSSFTSSVIFKEEIKANHLQLHLSSAVSRDISSIDCSDLAMQALITNKK